MYPKIIANNNAKYFKGVTRETSENLYDCVSHKFASPPKIPTMDNRKKSLRLGKIQPWGNVKKLITIIDIEKYKPISQTGSVVDNCLIVIATYERPKQKIIG